MDLTKVRPGEAAAVTQKDVRESNSVARPKNLREVSENSLTSQNVANRGDFVKWSADAEVFTEGMQAAKAAPDVRADKVKALKEAIAKGEYKVDSHAIADKMINESLELASIQAKKR